MKSPKTMDYAQSIKMKQMIMVHEVLPTVLRYMLVQHHGQRAREIISNEGNQPDL